jgi:uncharacterized protein (TIGR00369 family)
MAPTDTRVQVPPPCDLTLGMICTDKTQADRTVWTMLADERFANPAGIIQGGFLAALCDSSMGATTVTWARAREQKVFTANAEIKVSFLKAAKVGSTLTCTAWIIAGGRRTAFAEAEVVDDEARLIAKASSTYVLTPRE